MVHPCRAGFLFALLVLATGCGRASRPSETPHAKATLSSATVEPHIERLVVVDRFGVSMIARGGCMATMRSATTEASTHDELRVRCPRPERLRTWLEGADRIVATLALGPLMESDEDDEKFESNPPTVKLLTTAGKALQTTTPEDAEKMAVAVRALGVELDKAEKVTPGPASPNGWQMLHVLGPARVLVGGNPARGILEARMSTSGQYMCEFVTTIGTGPMRATKSGWLHPVAATRAIDQILGSFRPIDESERPATVFAAGTKDGTERQSDAKTTATVFERFADLQGMLGDACLPELESPGPVPLRL